MRLSPGTSQSCGSISYSSCCLHLRTGNFWHTTQSLIVKDSSDLPGVESATEQQRRRSAGVTDKAFYTADYLPAGKLAVIIKPHKLTVVMLHPSSWIWSCNEGGTLNEALNRRAHMRC